MNSEKCTRGPGLPLVCLLRDQRGIPDSHTFYISDCIQWTGDAVEGYSQIAATRRD
jgi:hypothetical protein